MADERIEDITGGELTSIAADDKMVILDTSDTTDDADGTVKYVELETLGVLATNAQTITTTDVTGAVGQFYTCTIAGLTANRNLTLPSASAGDRIGVHVVDGDASFELILIGAASQTINGGSAATEWSRVFIAGETVIFRCTAANTWIVEYDGRIPMKAVARLTTAADGESAGTYTVPTAASTAGAWTTDQNVGGGWNASTSVFTPRRSSVVVVDWLQQPKDGVSDQQYFGLAVHDGTANVADTAMRQSVSSSNAISAPIAAAISMTAGTAYELRYRSEAGGLGLRNLTGTNVVSFVEIL